MAETQYYGLYIMSMNDSMDKLASGNEEKIDAALHTNAEAITALQSLVPTPGSGDTGKFLCSDGSWQNVPAPAQATSDDLGTLKLGYSNSGKNYALLLDENGRGYVNVPWSDTTYNDATTSTHGLMSAADKLKLNGIAAGAQVNPGAATQSAAGLMSAADKKKLDGIASGAQVNPGVATTSANGLMSSTDKSKLNGIAAGAQVNPGNFGGTTGSSNGTSGLVPAPATQYRYAVLIGEGHWCSMQDVLNVTGAQAFSGINSSNQKLQFRTGECNNVAAINGEATVNFSPAFSNGCYIVLPVLRSTLNAVYNRFSVYDWTKTGFKYKAQNGSGANISFTWVAIGH